MSSTSFEKETGPTSGDALFWRHNEQLSIGIAIPVTPSAGTKQQKLQELIIRCDQAVLTAREISKTADMTLLPKSPKACGGSDS